MFKFTKNDLSALATMEFFLIILFSLYIVPYIVTNNIEPLIGTLIDLAKISAVIIFWGFVKFLDVKIVREHSWVKPVISVFPLAVIGIGSILSQLVYYSTESIIRGIVLLSALLVFGIAFVYMLWDAFFEYLKETSGKENSNSTRNPMG